MDYDDYLCVIEECEQEMEAMRAEITQLRAELASLSAENERLREAFTKPDHEILARVCYGVNCYPDELSDMLETYWEAMK